MKTTFTSRLDGPTCPHCGEQIKQGDFISWSRATKDVFHANCSTDLLTAIDKLNGALALLIRVEASLDARAHMAPVDVEILKDELLTAIEQLEQIKAESEGN